METGVERLMLCCLTLATVSDLETFGGSPICATETAEVRTIQLSEDVE